MMGVLQKGKVVSLIFFHHFSRFHLDCQLVKILICCNGVHGFDTPETFIGTIPESCCLDETLKLGAPCIFDLLTMSKFQITYDVNM